MNIIKLACFDFDGVFTNGEIIFNGNQDPVKKYNVKDGMGVKLLKDNNILICIISGFPKNNSVGAISHHLNVDYLFEGVDDKLKVIKELLEKNKISEKNIAYMGDDINDLNLLKFANLKGSPKNSIEEVKNNCNFISKFKGGEGAVREFCNYILDYNSKPSISGLICVKYESNRLPKKNFRKFGNTTLLDIKIKRLLELDFLDEVIVNTESEYILEYVRKKYKDRKVVLIKRDPFFSRSDIENKDFAVNMVKDIPREYVLYSPVTMPFIEKDTYLSMFQKLDNKNYDSIVLIADGIQGEGHSHEKHKFCFGASLMKKDKILNFKDFIGENPYFQKCNTKERIDIDYPEEFNLALYHYFNRDTIYGNENINSLKNNYLYKLEDQEPSICKNKKKIQIIDVTIRDGGFKNDWNFKKNHVKELMKASSDIGIDYFEIGYLTDETFIKKEDGIYRNISNSYIKKLVDDVKPKNKISVLFDSYRFNVEKILRKEETNIDLIRVVTYFRKEEILYALNQCKQIKQKGYLVSLNIMCISYFTDTVFNDLLEAIENNISYIDFIYLADTFGNMTPEKTVSIFSKLISIKNIKSSLKLGYHIHNNGQVAMSNMISSIKYIDILDVSWGGMGRGAGNLRLEDCILYLNINENYNFNLYSIFDFVEKEKTEEKIEEIKNTLLGFKNVHPNRIKYSKDKNLSEFYDYLNRLDEKEKLIY